MNALEAMDTLRNKKFIDRTENEKLIVLMWEEYNGYESMAMKAAAELAAFQSRLSAAEALVTKWRNDDPNDWTASDKQQCADALEAALASAAGQEATA